MIYGFCNLAITNACLATRCAIISVGSSVVRVTEGGAVTLLRDFPGASGLRALRTTEDGTIFASPEGQRLSDDQKGLWRSADGNCWHKAIDLSSFPNPSTIWGICPGLGKQLYAGAYTTSREGRLPVIFASANQGEDWSECYRDPTGRHIHDITVDKQSGAVYATIGDDFGPWQTRRIVRSVDHGATWTEILVGLPQIAPVVATRQARLFGSDCDSRTEIYRTTDDQTSTVVLSQPDSGEYFFWIRSDPDSGMLLAGSVAARADSPRAHIYGSLNDGASWTVVEILETHRRWDGAPAASDVWASTIVVALRSGGQPRSPLILDLEKLAARCFL